MVLIIRTCRRAAERTLCLLVAAFLPMEAAAQALPTQILKPGQHVWVTEGSGGERSGRVDQVTTDSLKLSLADGTRTIPIADIESVWRRDAVWDGLVAGFAAGSATTLLAWLLTRDGGSSSGGSFSVNLDPGFGAVLIGSAAVGVVTGAVGLGIDAAHHGRTLVYERPPQRGQVRLSPLLSRRGAGLRLTVRW